MAVKLKDFDVNPIHDVSFPLNLGSKLDNDMANTFRFAWENQNIDVHSQSLGIVISALNAFCLELSSSVTTRLIFHDDVSNFTNSIEIHLVGFDILDNKNFDGLQLFKTKASINPKNFDGSPLQINFRMFNMTADKFALIKQIGYFFIKGDGEINYVHDVAATVEGNVDVDYAYITDFNVNQVCFRNVNTNEERVLFGG